MTTSYGYVIVNNKISYFENSDKNIPAEFDNDSMNIMRMLVDFGRRHSAPLLNCRGCIFAWFNNSPREYAIIRLN